MLLSKRIRNMQESAVRKLIPYAQAAKSNGKKVYHLNIGQPDIPTPRVYYDAISEYIKTSTTIEYALSQGEPSLIEAVVDYYKRNDISFNYEDIHITTGGSEALLFAFICLCDAEDEIIVAEPYYTNYNGFAEAICAVIKPITTTVENEFRLPSKEVIEAAVTSKTKAILITNPGNPTGYLYTKEELDTISQIAIEHDLFIISDEVYYEFIYDGKDAISVGHLSEINDRIIMVDSISKRYSACGARIGTIACKNKEFNANFLKLCQARLSVATLEQVGAAALYKLDSSYSIEVVDEYEARRDIVYNALSTVEGVICSKSKGAFYVIVRLPVKNAENFCIWLLESFDYKNETVMLAPANGFYSKPTLGIDEVRIAYVLNCTDLKRAMDILKIAIKQYKGSKFDI